MSTIFFYRIEVLFTKFSSFSFTKLKNKLFEAVCVKTDNAGCRALPYLLLMPQNGTIENDVLLFEELQNNFVTHRNMKAYISVLLYFQQKLPFHRLPLLKSFPGDDNLWTKASFYRCILKNNYESAFNTLDDKNIVEATKEFIITYSEMNKELLVQQWFDLNNSVFNNFFNVNLFLALFLM